MKYFGTDGIRMPADKFTPEFITAVVQGLNKYAGEHRKVLIGGDTRESTEWILQDLATALESYGFEYASVGVLPTPAICYCFYEMGFDFAIDVTASHNPYVDNGLKIFERGMSAGEKLSEPGCEIIEQALVDVFENHKPLNQTLAATTDREDLHAEAVEIYQEHLKTYIGDADFQNFKIAVDCANGAMSVVSDTFAKFGATATVINNNQSYSTKINDNCGSTHLEQLTEFVVNNRLDCGIAFDGDGDRCLMIDADGAVVDGDEIIAILANYLNIDKIAVTVMSNQGLLNWAENNLQQTEITPVGDENVAAAMRDYQIPLGGEQCGHIILPGLNSGDGMLAALMVLAAMRESGKTLRALASIITKMPQVELKLEVTTEQKEALKTSEQAKQVLLEYNNKMPALSGRLLVRPSGTEPVIRIVMWGDDLAAITTLANELKTKLKEVL